MTLCSNWPYLLTFVVVDPSYLTRSRGVEAEQRTDHLIRGKKKLETSTFLRGPDLFIPTESLHICTMTTRKHNEFLDAPSDDDEASVRGYDSEENVAESKGRAVKKRRTDTQDFFGLGSDDDESADEEEEEDEEAREVKGKGSKQSKTTKRDTAAEEYEKVEAEDDEHDDEDEDGGAYLDTTSDEKNKPSKILSTKLLKKPKKDKSGVVYLSSLPPYLKPLVTSMDIICSCDQY